MTVRGKLLYSQCMKTDGEQESKAISDQDAKRPKKETTTPSKEDQMADWEEALKNDDWGHQPC